MLRFFSRRKPRGRAEQRGYEKAEKNVNRSSSKTNKNLLACRIILLDGADLSIDISVRLTIIVLSLKLEVLRLEGSRYPKRFSPFRFIGKSGILNLFVIDKTSDKSNLQIVK